MGKILMWLIALLAIKAIAIGSDFSFSHWIKYKGEYWNWYMRREGFEDHIKSTELKLSPEDLGKIVFVRTGKKGYIDAAILRRYNNLKKEAHISLAAYGENGSNLSWKRKYGDIVGIKDSD